MIARLLTLAAWVSFALVFVTSSVWFAVPAVALAVAGAVAARRRELGLTFVGALVLVAVISVLFVLAVAVGHALNGLNVTD